VDLAADRRAAGEIQPVAIQVQAFIGTKSHVVGRDGDLADRIVLHPLDRDGHGKRVRVVDLDHGHFPRARGKRAVEGADSTQELCGIGEPSDRKGLGGCRKSQQRERREHDRNRGSSHRGEVR
jgi:hypothetical protein